MKKRLFAMLLTLFMSLSLAACSSESSETVSVSEYLDETTTELTASLLDTSSLFTEFDLTQTPDLSDAVYVQLESGEDTTITTGGVYVFSGAVEETTIIVDAGDEAKVQLVLDGLSITNSDFAAIYVESADRVIITSTDTNNLSVTGSYDDASVDAVIFSKSDVILNGTGSVTILSSQGNGVTSKDDLKVTGGEYDVTALLDGLEANDSIVIYDGDITINSGKDGLHSEYDEDMNMGYIYLYNGSINIDAVDDGIHANSVVQIDGGTINITSSTEGIEGTYIQINAGDINIYSSDDGINATNLSDYDVVIEVNGGKLNVEVGSGDTDAFDANGSIYITGGYIEVTAPTSSFDYDTSASWTNGTIFVNGEKITEFPQEMMGGGTKGGRMH